MRKLIVTAIAAASLAGCGGGGEKTQVTLDERLAPAPSKSEPTPRPQRAPSAHCPRGATGCRSVRGLVVHVQAVDPDGDGDAHLAVLDRRGLTYPGIAVIKLTRDMRPRRLPRAGDEVSAAGPVQKSSDGSREIRASELHVLRR